MTERTEPKREPSHHMDDACCADLVLNLLPPPEREAALAHAAACPDCAMRLRAHVSATMRMRAEQPAAMPGRVLRLPRAGLATGLAAAAALLLIVGWPRQTARGPTHVTHWLTMPADGVLLRDGESTDPHLAAGFAAYARHDLAAARRELLAAHAEASAEQARRVYLAHVLLLQGDAAPALELLRSLAWLELPSAIQHDAAELLVLALRATGHPASADSLERALVTTPGWVPIRP